MHARTMHPSHALYAHSCAPSLPRDEQLQDWPLTLAAYDEVFYSALCAPGADLRDEELQLVTDLDLLEFVPSCRQLLHKGFLHVAHGVHCMWRMSAWGA